MLSNDRQVIDLHWLSVRGYRAATDAAKKIFEPEFDFTAACRFVRRVGKAEVKAQALALPPSFQAELAVLHDSETRALVWDLYKRTDQIKAKINRALNAPGSRAGRGALEHYFMCYKALRLAAGCCTNAAELYKYMTHEPIAANTMSRRRQWLRRAGVLN